MSRPLRVLALGPAGPLPIVATAREAIVHECQDLADLLGRAAAGAADLAVVAADCAGLDRAAVARLVEAGCPVLGVADESSQAELLRRIGIGLVARGVVDAATLRSAVSAQGSGPRAPASAAQGAATIEDSAAPGALPSEGAGARGRLVAVWGPPGAPGRTAVARGLAAAAHEAGLVSLFVDADPAGGEPGGQPAGGLARACRLAAVGRFDGAALQDCCSGRPGGFAELVGLPGPTRWSDVGPNDVREVVAVARAAVDVVVVDVGQDIRPAHPAYDVEWAHDSAASAREALAAADHVVAVLAATPSGVARFAAWWPVLQEQADSLFVVANRVGSPGGGARPVAQVRQVLGELGHPEEPVVVEQGADPMAHPLRELLIRWGLTSEPTGAVRRRTGLRRVLPPRRVDGLNRTADEPAPGRPRART